MTAVKKFNISHISQHLKLLTEFLPEHCDYRDAEWLSEIQIDIHRQV